MDIKTVKNVIALFEASSLSEIEVSEENAAGGKLNIRLSKAAAPCAAPSAAPAATVFREEAKEATTLKLEIPTKLEMPTSDVVDFNRSYEVKSPMVGVYYAGPAPDSAPFVKKGSKVKKGDTLCIIEAMKLMNEVVAERDGEVIEVCAEGGNLVEFGQTLFKIC